MQKKNACTPGPLNSVVPSVVWVPQTFNYLKQNFHGLLHTALDLKDRLNISIE